MLLLRIFLVLAILAGIGVIVVSQVMLKPQIEGIISVREENHRKFVAEEDKARKLGKSLKETQTELTRTKGELETTKSQLVDFTAKFESEQKRAVGLQAALDKTRSDLKGAQDELAAYVNTSYKPNEIRALADTAKSQKMAIDGLTDELKVFAERYRKATNQLAQLMGPSPDPPIPSTVRGRVLVVDPKWNFLVLDIGEKQDVPEKGVLLVAREGVLIAKVRVMSVQKDRCIANIMPGWKLKDVLEGDQVLPY
jgi:hypothetical protein